MVERHIKESDWKYLSRLKPVLLERACARINKEVELMLKNVKDREQHLLYLEMYRGFVDRLCMCIRLQPYKYQSVHLKYET